MEQPGQEAQKGEGRHIKDLSAILRQFPNISENFRRLPKIPENYPRITKTTEMSEGCRRCPKTAKEKGKGASWSRKLGRSSISFTLTPTSAQYLDWKR